MLKDMIKIIGTLCLVCFLYGCGYDAYPGNDAILDQYEATDGNVPVLIDVGNLSGEMGSETRQTRGNEDNDPWRERNIYVYAFERNAQNIFHTRSISNKDICLIDANSSTYQSNAGKKAEIPMDDKRIRWMDSPEVEYYPKNRTPYTFYAYYLDGAPLHSPVIRRERESISFDIRFDGTHDFMLAKSELDHEKLKLYSEAEREKIKSTYYSGYTTLLNFCPSLKFRHVMSRFTFHVKAMNSEAEHVYLNEIACFTSNKATLTVAGNEDIVLGARLKDGPTDTLHLAEDRQNAYRPLRQNFYHGEQEQYTQVGGHLLLPPGTTDYLLQFSMAQEIDGKVRTYKDTIRVRDNGKPFEPNRQYAVNINVYGLQRIIPEVTVSPWEKGGEGNLDTDQPFYD